MSINLSIPERFAIAILFTALAYVIGIFIVQKKWKIIASLFIGAVVVSIGYLSASLGFPIWLIVLMPVPFGFIILCLFSGRNIRKPLLTYACTWASYIVFHLILSSVFKFHSLIPSWKLRI